MVILIAGLFCLARKRVEYLRNQVFYHRAKGEHPERKKNIKSSNKTTPEKTGQKKNAQTLLALPWYCILAIDNGIDPPVPGTNH